MLNPAVCGFHPDPSVVRVGDDYYLACSSFEYFPGIPLFHSTDAEHWTPIGHVVTRPGQIAVEHVPTGGGVWAPTIRHHDGLFWITVTDAMGRGALIFTAERAEGPWSDGLAMQGAPGIDHDIAWDADGACYVTFSGLNLEGEDIGRHLGIQQVRMDTTTGLALEEPRSLWSGTGLKFPEAPHLYEIDGAWYLMIAEGGTERGHSISIARGDSPTGPFEGCPANPVYSHRSTNHPVQNAGHGDLVRTDTGWVVILLGTRPGGMTQAFAPMGRETFATTLSWVDGWPVVDRFELTADRPPVTVRTTFDAGVDLGLEWLSVRDADRPWATLDARPGWLRLHAADADAGAVAMDAERPRFLGRRQQHVTSRCAALVDTGTTGVGGLSVRYDEAHHYDIEVGGGVVLARVRLDQVDQTWAVPAPDGPVELWITTEPPVAAGLGLAGMTCDVVRLGYGTGDDAVEVAAMDGRYLTSDTTASFTGRVTGMYAAAGDVAFEHFTYEGHHG
ncbi:glycoside hydrolase family 43 protein [Pengzhenrongella frigida]|uniref:Glycoside hydrolase family 43 protein n=1 Tax=Pengzhenrongella frigida TaxID=1259133 RepID=A0A4Q5MYM2_9MICO|nr:glycoside hydrolase family 43 protein [Cellulomonas sp. HLT2-17]RYV50790.1 glycoside hydrolase family 43 protein [Cellulomonas sp. HLT2-17]